MHDVAALYQIPSDALSTLNAQFRLTLNSNPAVSTTYPYEAGAPRPASERTHVEGLTVPSIPKPFWFAP
jgi:hypothetical protein